MTAIVRDVVAVLETAYPTALAESWDAVGLVCGDPVEPVQRVLVAIDPVAETVAEALELDVQLPTPGVSDALAHALGLRVTGILDLREGSSRTGLGRICELDQPESLRAFTSRVIGALPETALPETAWGVRAAGDPQRPVHTVAVCGGAGDSLLGAAARAHVDAFVTADLRHHLASEHLAAGGPALVDVAHWASEHPWCAQAAAVVSAALGGTVDVHVSYRRTDPWTIGLAQPAGRPSR